MVMALEEKPDLTLCLATGNSPTRAYELFTASVEKRALGVGQLRFLKLDEWGGLASDDPATCEVYLQRYLVAPLGLRREQLVGFQSDAENLDGECLRIERHLLDADQIDVCVLGLGVNGHIGFNEPAAELSSRAHIATLSDASLGHSMLRETSVQTSVGLTLGMADILASREILLLVFGTEKAKQLKTLLEGGVTTQFPASFLQLHSRITCLCDRAAASQLTLEN
jgi:galactosamine-6-phosphate isomerase